MIRGVIFDLDGTTINTLDDLTDGVNMTMAEYGYPLKTTEDVRLGIGRGFRKLMEKVIPAEVDEETRNKVGKRFVENYGKVCLNKSRAYPGMPEVMKELQDRGIKVAVNSNKGDALTKRLIYDNFPGIDFVAVYGEREGVPHKPDPSGALEIMELMGLNRDEVLYVGDSDTDIQTGKNAGMKTVGCLWGFRDYETLKDADYIIAETKEVLNCL